MQKDGNVGPPAGSRLRVMARTTVLLGIVVFGFFYLMIAAGAASFIHECNTLLCAQLHQSVFAALGGLTLFVAGYRMFMGKPSAPKVAFFGTLPILVIHVILVVTDPNESIFFPLSTTPPPAISGAVLLLQRSYTG